MSGRATAGCPTRSWRRRPRRWRGGDEQRRPAGGAARARPGPQLRGPAPGGGRGRDRDAHPQVLGAADAPRAPGPHPLGRQRRSIPCSCGQPRTSSTATSTGTRSGNRPAADASEHIPDMWGVGGQDQVTPMNPQVRGKLPSQATATGSRCSWRRVADRSEPAGTSPCGDCSEPTGMLPRSGSPGARRSSRRRDACSHRRAGRSTAAWTSQAIPARSTATPASTVAEAHADPSAQTRSEWTNGWTRACVMYSAYDASPAATTTGHESAWVIQPLEPARAATPRPSAGAAQ